MTKIKLCGLSRIPDIKAANRLRPDFVGFVFAKASRRHVAPDQAARMKELLSSGISAVGVFVDEDPRTVAALLNKGIIDAAQLHGREDEAYIRRLKTLTDKPVIKAFMLRDAAAKKQELQEEHDKKEAYPADYIMLDAGAGAGEAFDWALAEGVRRPYFLAGGLSPGNVAAAISRLHPYAVDVSSGIETDGYKDSEKMEAFVAAVRRFDLQ